MKRFKETQILIGRLVERLKMEDWNWFIFLTDGHWPTQSVRLQHL